jgi:hypothetical protein
MTTITVQTPSFSTRAPRGARLLAALAYQGWRGVRALRNWVRLARAAETRPSHR